MLEGWVSLIVALLLGIAIGWFLYVPRSRAALAAADALRDNSQSFLQLAKTALEKFQEGAKGDLEARQKAVHDLVQPLRESLQKVDDKLGELENARVSAYSALQEQLKALVETHLPTLRNETANLGKAVEAYNKATVTLESRVLVSARRFSNLKAAREDTQIATPGLIEVIPRALQAPEMAATEGDNDEV